MRIFEFKVMKLKLVTWNVWFSPHEMSLRTHAMMNILQRINPDVICLQEVTHGFLQEISRLSWIVDGFLCSDKGYDGSTIDQYGCATLCKKSLDPTFSFVNFENSYMGRHLLTTRCIISGRNQCIDIGNVHLESLNNACRREEQLGVCATLLSPGKSVLVGDFNFCSERNYYGSLPLENDCLCKMMPSYEDLWRKLKPEEIGYTFDSVANRMLKKYEQARYVHV